MKNHNLLALAAACFLVPSAFAKSPPPAAVRFVAFGDAGAGSGAQHAVADAIAQVCAVRGCDFAVLLGDNFYPDGVHSVDDPQFETKFEEPYEALHFPFYAALGNHDNGEPAVHNEYGDFQVAYTQRSAKWRMPARYYEFSAPLDELGASGSGAAPDKPVRAEPVEALVDLFGLDSTPLSPYEEDPDPEWRPENYGAAQLHWLQDALARSGARWKIAFAHHPYTDGAAWREFLQQSLCPAGVDLLLNGHDHYLRWMKAASTCGKTEFITSGAGGAQLTFDKSDVPAYFQASRYGFFWFEVTRERLTGVAFALTPDAELPLDRRGRPRPAFERTLKKR